MKGNSPIADRFDAAYRKNMRNRPVPGDCPDLTTGRLSLRRPADRDVDAIVGIAGNWEVARHLARVPHPYSIDDARFFLDRVVPAEWVWAVALRGCDTLRGIIGLTPERSVDAAELGYWLSPAFWNRGMTTEAARAVISFGFDFLGLTLLTSGYFGNNPASGRVLRKLGFTEAGRETRFCLATGDEVPSIRMGLPRSV